MITIQIPEWLQWAAVGLAVAYAFPRALRTAVVAIYWSSKLLSGRWPLTMGRRGLPDALRPEPILANRRRIWTELRTWALNGDAIQAVPRTRRDRRISQDDASQE